MNYKSKQQLGCYLAGLWEGDGNIAVKSAKYPKPTVNITFHSHQVPVAVALRDLISKQSGDQGSCSIFHHPYRNACYFSIHSISGLKVFVHLINGKLKTPKAYQIKWIIDWCNAKHGANLVLKNVCVKPVDQNAWLAGFIDADGSFAVRQTSCKHAVKKLVECQMTLVQRTKYKKTNQSYEPLFQSIAQTLKTNVNVVAAKASTTGEQYKIKVTSAKSKAILRRYLDKYPLLTSKFLDYQNWCRVDDLMIAKKHYTAAGSQQIQTLKSQMNRSRTIFTWDHLIEFL